MDKLDFIIVGQGLAGSCLGHLLLARGKRFKIIDNAHKNASTKIAAGMINPVTGRKFVKSWLIDTLIPFAKDFYAELESTLGVSLMYPVDIKRNIPSVQAVNDWMARCQDDSYTSYVKPVLPEKIISNHIYSEFGFATIKNALRINLALFLEKSKALFLEKEVLVEGVFNYKELVLGEELAYANLNADNVIFAEGFKAIENPFLEMLPFRPVKGEVVILRIPHLNLDYVLRHNRFLVPLGNDLYWTGGGYDKVDLTEDPTDEFMQKLKEDLAGFLDCPYEIVSHQAAVRPAIKDRKPVLGAQQDNKNIFICNGMGTKGASLAPYFTQHLLEHIIDAKGLMPEVDVQRFYSLREQHGREQ